MGCCHSGQHGPEPETVEFVRPERQPETAPAPAAPASDPRASATTSIPAAKLPPQASADQPPDADAATPPSVPVVFDSSEGQQPVAEPTTAQDGEQEAEVEAARTRMSKLEEQWSARVEEHARQSTADKDAEKAALMAAEPPAEAAEFVSPSVRTSRTSRTSNSSGLKAKHLTTSQLKQVLRDKGVDIPPDATRSILEVLKREAEAAAGEEEATDEDRLKVEEALEVARSKRESRAELKENLEAKLASRV